MGLLGSERADELRHQVGKPEDGEDEDEEGLFRGSRRYVRVAVGGGSREPLKGGEGGRCKGCGVGRRGPAGDFGEESAGPAEECVDAEDGA